MIVRSLLCVACSLLVASAAPQGDAKTLAELEKLQGTWQVVALEVDGTKMADNQLKNSKIVVNGSNFTSISMGGTYKGTIKLDPANKPRTLDLIYEEGHLKGTKSLAIYDLDGDTWKICLTVSAQDRPTAFATKVAAGLALETLHREAGDKAQDAAKKELASLEGEWTMISGEIGGQKLPDDYVKSAKRTCKGNETTVIIGGAVFFKATTSVDPTKSPKTIDYAMTEGPSKGKTQLGIYELKGDTVRFCMAAPGKDRPTDFTTKTGDDRTFSEWKKAAKK